MNETAKNSAEIAAVGRRAREALAVRQALFDVGLATFERQPMSIVSVLDIRRLVEAIKAASGPISAS